MFEKNLLLPYLLDIYGSLLSERKKELLDYYYGEDYSLSEISELTGISRQGVRDSIKKSEAELLDIEDKLRLFEKRKKAESLIHEAKSLAEGNTALTAVLDALEEAAT